jgi:hypothetical protein
MTAVDVREDIQAHLIPGGTLIPAMVGEISRAQSYGWPLVYVPIF